MLGWIILTTIVCQVTTEEAARDVAAFVATFFESFPKFKGRPFHLTGESYAVGKLDELHDGCYSWSMTLKGRYLPVYATAIYDQNTDLEEKGITPVNLNSVLIGNPSK